MIDEALKLAEAQIDKLESLRGELINKLGTSDNPVSDVAPILEDINSRLDTWYCFYGIYSLELKRKKDLDLKDSVRQMLEPQWQHVGGRAYPIGHHVEPEQSHKATCAFCNQVMEDVKGCKVEYLTVNGTIFQRIQYGKYGIGDGETGTCHDCGCAVGGYHHFGCDMEECPACHKQLISCGCNVSVEPTK